MPAFLSGLQGGHAQRQIPLAEAPTTFGRNPDNTVVIDSGRASRRHAEIRSQAGMFVLADLGSSNGTYVNGQRLAAPHTLRPGDVIQIGDDTFRFDASPAPAAYPSAPPTVPAGNVAPNYQPPAAFGGLPNTPAAVPAPARRGIGRTLLIVLGLVGLLVVAACVGGAVLLTRSTGGLVAQPANPAGATPQPNAAAGNTGNTASGAQDTWTVLVYLDGDNNLEKDALKDLNEMELVGSNDQVRIVVQLDRVRQDGPKDDTSNGDWDTAKRFLVKRDSNRSRIGSTELDDIGEVNMGDPQTLVDFVSWGVKTYPAERYALVLWDHGSSWAGIAFDDSSDKKGISLPELDQALRTIQSQTGIERFDLIGFDACLMAQIDVLQTIEPYGKFAVASAELEPNDGWAWDTWLQNLETEPSQDTAAVAKSIVDAYQEFYQNADDDTVTLSAFDLGKLAPVRDGLNTLADIMLREIGSAYQPIAEARSSADAYSQPKPEEFNAIDLGDFARLLSRQGAPGEIDTAAKSLSAAIKAARVAEWHASFHQRSTGMSVFFPQIAELYPDFYPQASPVPQNGSWDEFLQAFHSAGQQQVSAPTISDLQLSSLTVGVNNPATLEGTVSGKDIAFIFFFAGIPNTDRSGVELTDLHYIYPPGSSPNAEVPPWNDGDNDLRETWNGTRWALSNGSETIPVLLGPTKYGTDLYGVEGMYTAAGTGEQVGAGLLFAVSQGRAELQRIYGFPKGKAKEAQPFEITPQPGDTFTAYLRTYTIKDGRPVPDFNEGETITLGNAPLTAQLVPANSGDYVAGFLVRDIAGQFTYQYSDITVDNSGAGTADPNAPTPEPAQPGAQAGTLAFSSPEGKFALAYPNAWQTLDTGKSQMYFYDPAETSMSFASVEYLTLKQAPADANQRLIDTYIGILQSERDFRPGDVQDATLGGEAARMFQFAYTNKDGKPLAGVAVVTTNPATGLSYVVTLQALQSDFDGQLETFKAILNSFEMTS